MEGWVKIHRKMIDWRWYGVTNVKVTFFHLLLRSNHKDGFAYGYEVKKGQVLTSYESLSKETGLTIMQVRTAIKKLIKTGEISQKITNRFSIITICNYENYQCNDDDEQQPNNKQITTNKNNKNIKNDKNISFLLEKVEPKNVCLFFSKQSREWIDNAEMTLRIGKDDAKLNSLVIDFQSHLISSGAVAETEKETKSHFLNWARKVLANDRKQKSEAGTNARELDVINNEYQTTW